MTRVRKEKVNIPMTMASILFCLVLITSYMMSGLYARYTSQSSGNDSANVAAFKIETAGDIYSEELVLSLAPGVSTRQLTVSNQSEVDVNCTMVIENKTDNLPLKFMVYKADQRPAEGVPAADQYTSVSAMDSGEETTYVLEITWPKEHALEDMGKVDLVTIDIKVVQID